MIPHVISWSYQRVDENLKDNSHGIAITCNYTDKDILLKDLIPKHCDSFMMYLITIIPQDDNVIIVSVIKTKENIMDEDTIAENSYYGYYLIPSEFDVITNNLRITDLTNSELYIEFNSINILNKLHLNYNILPKSLFKFN